MAGIVATLANIDGPGVRDNKRADRYTLTNGAPTITAGAGLGTLGTASILGGWDAAMSVRLTTGASAMAPGTVAVIALANVLASTPNPAVLPIDADSVLLNPNQLVRASVRGLGTIDLVTAGTLGASTAFDFSVMIPDATVSLALAAASLAAVERVESSGVPIVSESLSGATATLGLSPRFSSGEVTLVGPG